MGRGRQKCRCAAEQVPSVKDALKSVGTAETWKVRKVGRSQGLARPTC